MNILITDDNVINCIYIERILKKKGVGVEKAYNGKEALSLLNDKIYDAVIMDIQMPVMDGTEAVKQIRKEEKFKNLYIAALTGYAESDDIETYLLSGFNEVLIKPVDDYMLYKFIDKVEQHKLNSAG